MRAVAHVGQNRDSVTSPTRAGARLGNVFHQRDAARGDAPDEASWLLRACGHGDVPQIAQQYYPLALAPRAPDSLLATGHARDPCRHFSAHDSLRVLLRWKLLTDSTRTRRRRSFPTLLMPMWLLRLRARILGSGPDHAARSIAEARRQKSPVSESAPALP